MPSLFLDLWPNGSSPLFASGVRPTLFMFTYQVDLKSVIEWYSVVVYCSWAVKTDGQGEEGALRRYHLWRHQGDTHPLPVFSVLQRHHSSDRSVDLSLNLTVPSWDRSLKDSNVSFALSMLKPAARTNHRSPQVCVQVPLQLSCF